MTPDRPRLSLCIVVRDAETDLRRTLDSLQAQLTALQALPAEVVVVDGDSVDGSRQLAEHWAARSGLNATCHRQTPTGIYPAMNLAWRQASGEWLLFINAGDLLLEASGLEDLLTAADRQGIDSVQCRAAIFPPRCHWASTSGHRPISCHQSLLYRRRLHQTLGAYDERLGLCADLLLIRAIEQGRHRHDPLLLAATQVCPGNASRTSRRVRQDLARLRQWGIPLQPWPSPRQTLAVLWLEERLGVSLSIWIRVALELLRGSSHLIRLPDAPR
ncbi:MAG: glycosyltransferase [Cyanobacteriota bacterium]|nr:glycosyltransferase [Cyanobacteriota bacterium]